jgi:hypothetical protein
MQRKSASENVSTSDEEWRTSSIGEPRAQAEEKCCGPVAERGGQGSEELLQEGRIVEVPVSVLESLC